MHELDLALNADPEPKSRKIIPMLLGVAHDFNKPAELQKYRAAWQTFHQLSTLPDAEAAAVMDRWEQNLQQLDSTQAIDATPYTGMGKGWEEKILPTIVKALELQVAAVLDWQQDAQQRSQQQQPNVHDTLPDNIVDNPAALTKLKNSIEAACEKQQAALHSSTHSSPAGTAPKAVPPLVVQLLGMPGMGKSTLALQVAHRYEQTGAAQGVSERQSTKTMLCGTFSQCWHGVLRSPYPHICQPGRHGMSMLTCVHHCALPLSSLSPNYSRLLHWISALPACTSQAGTSSAHSSRREGCSHAAAGRTAAAAAAWHACIGWQHPRSTAPAAHECLC